MIKYIKFKGCMDFSTVFQTVMSWDQLFKVRIIENISASHNSNGKCYCVKLWYQLCVYVCVCVLGHDVNLYDLQSKEFEKHCL